MDRIGSLRRGVRRGAGAALLALVLAVAPLAATPASAAGPIQCPTPSPTVSPSPVSGGVGLTAVVCGPTAAPTTGTSTGGGSSSGGLSVVGSGASSGAVRGGASAGAVGSPSSVATSTPTVATLADSVDLGGILSVGGLSTGTTPSINPFDGVVQVWFTVRNTSSSTIDLSTDFWMENPLGLRVSNIDGVAVSGLKPGETRTVSADLPGAGQWTMLTTHARITPPAQVDGTELAPLTRDATVFVLPWAIVLLAGLGVAAAIAVSLVRRASAAAVPLAVGA